MRISDLPDSIKRVCEILLSGMEPYQVDKSFGNNGATIQFYFNLQDNTETLIKGKDATLEVIRNFILKFQFPNTRTLESFRNTLNDKILFAPYRAIVSVLYKLALNESNTSHLTHDEILFFFFCNSKVCTNPNFDIDKLINRITSYRNRPYDITSSVRAKIKWNQYERQLREMMTVLQYASSIFKNRAGILSFVMPTSTDDIAFIHEVISYNRIWYPSNIEDFNLSNKEYISYMDTAKTPYYVIELNKTHKLNNKKGNECLQQIYYGAPGTGKSHTVKKQSEGESVVRTTFHPDSDYSTFVGCYKPTTKKVAMRDVTGKIIVENDGTQVTEDRIVYEFVDQAFLQAYIKAWKFYAEAAEGAEPKKQYLIIEEINRGNCAQIFGDLFQLLDRNGYGFSDYYIHADKDMQKHLSKAFNNIDIDESHRNAINSLYPKDGDVVAKVLSGEILLLPDNLYIWATMNTSDQSLFPIDSAFKRRWDWEYEPIKYKNTNWVIDINGNKFSWVSFQREINKRIFDATSSEDKMLGDYFVNPADGIVTEKILLNKILFYLWNDVCKEGEGDIFKVSETEDVTFSELHGEGGSEKLVAMMKYLGVSSVNNTAEDDLNEEPIGQESKTWYQNLWADVRNNLSNKGLENVPAPRERQTYQLGVGLTGISVLANVPRTKANGYVGYYIEKQQASDIYPKLLTLKNAIEDKLGELDWHREGDRYAVVKRRLDLNGINDDSLRIGFVENLSTLLVDFKDAILPLIDQLR